MRAIGSPAASSWRPPPSNWRTEVVRCLLSVLSPRTQSIEPPRTPVRIPCMGVLHMTVPSSIPFSPTLVGRLPRKRVAETVRLLPVAPAAPVADSEAMQTSQQGTLLPSQQKVEIPLERSPQQIAEQEATLKLVRQCMAGEQQAWQQLVVSQHRRIYGICYRFTNSCLRRRRPDPGRLHQGLQESEQLTT